ncbi:hypothetical protein IAD21_00587 [Abditibacteriota bacterium]|nr:hypothetical protein IAD21_00587 [Abditibacteriota bacterium]
MSEAPDGFQSTLKFNGAIVEMANSIISIIKTMFAVFAFGLKNTLKHLFSALRFNSLISQQFFEFAVATFSNLQRSQVAIGLNRTTIATFRRFFSATIYVFHKNLKVLVTGSRLALSYPPTLSNRPVAKALTGEGFEPSETVISAATRPL